jgi:hypothetical protein
MPRTKLFQALTLALLLALLVLRVLLVLLVVVAAVVMVHQAPRNACLEQRINQ